MGNPMIPKVYDLLDTRVIPSCFSRFPAGINVSARKVEESLAQIGIDASAADSRERRRALTRHSHPYGNAFAICHCSADPEKLVILASLVEVMWIHDDVTEELHHAQVRHHRLCYARVLTMRKACREYATLSQVLRLDIDPSRVAPENVRQKALSEVIRAAIDMDNPQASEMIQTLKTYLDSFDSRADDFDNMEEYTAYRIPNCGYWYVLQYVTRLMLTHIRISSYFIRWGLGITLTQEDYRSIDAFDRAMGNVLGLTNGYFSWNVEKHQPTDRIRNAMRVLMKEHNIDSEAAQSMLLGIIVQEETSAAQLKQRRLQAPVSEALGQYFEAIELYVGGSCYWHATAPRYQIVE